MATNNETTKKQAAVAPAASEPVVTLSIDEQLKAIQLQHAVLELEDLTNRVQNERERRAAIVRAHKATQESIDQADRDKAREQGTCRHKKGGKNMEGILNGNDANYSVIKHTYPWGVTAVHCTRCGKEWWPAPAAMKKANPAAYKQQQREYVEALNLPTDNEPSGSLMFSISYESPEMAAARA